MNPIDEVEPDGDDVSRIRRALLAALPALLIADEIGAQDAATAQPRSFRVVLDNDKVRVLEFNARPGLGLCGSGMHSHPPHLTIALSPAKTRVKLPDGKVFTVENKVGDVFWSEAETHETENITGRDARALMVEIKPAIAKT